MTIKTLRYWDANCCHGYLWNQADRQEACERVLADADAGNAIVVISAWTIAEVLHVKGDKRSFPKESTDKIRKFFRRSCFEVAQLDRMTAELAQDIFWEHDIMPRDALHIATALMAGVNFLETYEKRLIDMSRKLGGDPQLVVQLPGEDIERAMKEKAAKKLQGDLGFGSFAS